MTNQLDTLKLIDWLDKMVLGFEQKITQFPENGTIYYSFIEALTNVKEKIVSGTFDI